MTKNDIMRMAQEAGKAEGIETIGFHPVLKRFATLVAAAEREACAALAEQGTGEPMQTRTMEICLAERQRIAAAIRARSKT